MDGFTAATYADAHFAIAGAALSATPLAMLLGGKYPGARSCTYTASLLASLSVPSAIMGMWLNVASVVFGASLWAALALASQRETRLASTAA